MNFRQFEALYWIGRLGSFHAAARHLRTSQPAISARMREMENDLGVAIFDRSARRVRLTAKGEELKVYATQIMSIAAQVHERVAAPDALSGRVRLGVLNVAAVTWLPRLLEVLARTNPGIRVEFTVECSEILHERIVQGGLDVAVLAGPVTSSKLASESVGRVQLVWVAAPSLAVPEHELSAAELAAWPIISDTVGSHLRAAAMDWFRAEGVEPPCHHSCSSLPTRLQLAAQGVGIVLAVASAASADVARGALRQVATRRVLPALDYVIAYPDIGLTPVSRVVAETARKVIGQSPELDSFYAAYAGRAA